MFKKIYTLTTTQSKALIAKGIVSLPEIENVLKTGNIFLSRGTTNAFILEELYKKTNSMPEKGFNKGDFVAGQVFINKKYCSIGVNPGPFMKEIYFEKGEPKEAEFHNRLDIVSKFKAGDIILKGGNALDPNGTVGIYAGDIKNGGTIGTFIGCILAKGLDLIVPIGLEKMVWSTIEDISENIGAERTMKPLEGMKIGMIPVHGNVFTELEALEQLFYCEAMHVGSGGVGGAEGSVSIVVATEFEEEIQKVDKLMDELASIPNFECNRKN